MTTTPRQIREQVWLKRNQATAAKMAEKALCFKAKCGTVIVKDGEVIGEGITNQSLTFDQAMELAGFVWKTLAANGVECDGWYDGDDLYDESSAEMVY